MVLAAFALVVAQRVSVTWLGFDLRSVTGMSLDGSVVVGNVGLPWSPKPVVWTAQKGAFNPCATGGQEYGWAFGVLIPPGSTSAAQIDYPRFGPCGFHA